MSTALEPSSPPNRRPVLLRPRRSTPLLVGLANAAVLALVLAALVPLLLARRNMNLGAQELQLAMSAGQLPLGMQKAAVRQTFRADVARAHGAFSSARSDLALWSPILPHLGWVPGIGGELAAAPATAEAAAGTTSAIMHLMNGLEPLWPLVTQAGHGGSTLARLTSPLQAEQTEFTAAHADAEHAALALPSIPSHTGSRALDIASHQLRQNIGPLRQATAWLALAPTLLGAAAPSRYLVAWQDPAELRATGGFIAAADLVTVDRGMLRTHFTGSALPHEIPAIMPLPQALYTNEGDWLFRDSNWSPDFSLSARLERWFYGEDTSRWADGVVNLGGGAAAAILKAVGPVYLPGYHRWVDATSVNGLVQQYVNGPYKGPQTGTSDTVRKQFIGAVSQAILQHLQALSLQQWSALGAALHESIASGDILLYHRRPAVETAIRSIGAGGGFDRPNGDFLYVVDDNRSYSKLNPYVREQASYRVDIGPDLWLHCTLTLRYHVVPSPDTLEGFGPAYGAEATKHDYQDFIRVYVPRGAKLQLMSGAELWAPRPAYGLTQLAGRILVPAGHTVTLVLRYTIPANALAGSHFTRYRLTIQRQPSTNITAVQVRIKGRDGLTVMTGRQGTSMDVPLTAKSAQLQLVLGGTIRPRIVQLPRSTAIDPYVPYGYLHDPRHPL